MMDETIKLMTASFFVWMVFSGPFVFDILWDHNDV